MLPTVDFCGIKVTRLIIGANPFGGYSHQSAERDRKMLDYYTIAQMTAYITKQMTVNDIPSLTIRDCLLEEEYEQNQKR